MGENLAARPWNFLALINLLLVISYKIRAESAIKDKTSACYLKISAR